jgi:hypothetical protein
LISPCFFSLTGAQRRRAGLGRNTPLGPAVAGGEAFTQPLQRFLAVLVLGAGFGGGDDDAGRQVLDAYRRFRLVLLLPTGSGGLVEGYYQVFLVKLAHFIRPPNPVLAQSVKAAKGQASCFLAFFS